MNSIFNNKTLFLIAEYLKKNIEELKIEKNESGFFRITLPQDVYREFFKGINCLPGESLSDVEKIRLNFWPFTRSSYSLSDKSTHNHPRSFTSFIISGGYKHIIYKEVVDLSEFNNLDNTEIVPFYKVQLNRELGVKKMIGKVGLRPLETIENKKNMIVRIDSSLIHRIIAYNTTPEESTLSINIVYKERNSHQNLHIYLPTPDERYVKTSRTFLEHSAAKAIGIEMISLINRNLSHPRNLHQKEKV